MILVTQNVNNKATHVLMRSNLRDPPRRFSTGAIALA